MFDSSEVSHDDLHSGISPWKLAKASFPFRTLTESRSCDVVIVGAGITGALIAEHMSRRGLSVAVIDRETPAHGSTLASTAMVLWEIDKPLSELASQLSFERAAHIYRQSFHAVQGLAQLIIDLSISCDCRLLPSLYLADNDPDDLDLKTEAHLRLKAGLPSEFLSREHLAETFRMQRRAAILSLGSADLEPVRLTNALLEISAKRGSLVVSGQVEKFESTSRRAAVTFDSGIVIESDWLILATGYSLPDFLHLPGHQLASTWAICTPPQSPQAIWPQSAMIWEASENYIYARTTVDRRIIIGGEDQEDVTDPEERDALIHSKTNKLKKRLSSLIPHANPTAQLAWTGTFGKSSDGLPFIGNIPQQPRMLAAYGYGGNGITFSFLASRIVDNLIRGDKRAWFDEFALDRSSVTQNHSSFV